MKNNKIPIVETSIDFRWAEFSMSNIIHFELCKNDYLSGAEAIERKR